MPSSPREEAREPEERKLVTIPQIPALLEAAGLKKVGPARIRQLVAEDPTCPKPVFEDGRTRIFDWHAMEHYFRGRVTEQGKRTDLTKETPPDDPEHDTGTDEATE